LIQTFIDNPEDDLPRLVFADWQEEHGQIAHAELIRVQCALAVPPTRKDYNRTRLMDREKKLLRSPELRVPLRKAVTYQRGFIPHLFLSWRESEWLLEQGNIDGLPLDRVLTFGYTIQHSQLNLPPDNWVKQFLESSWLGRIDCLSFEYDYLQASDFQSLSTSPYFHRVQNIRLRTTEIPIESFTDFLLSPHLRSLKVIDLYIYVPFEEEENLFYEMEPRLLQEMIHRVFDSPQIRNWKYFAIHAPGIGEEAMSAVLESPYLENMKELWFPSASISEALWYRLRGRFRRRIRFSEHIDE
jgi:uncharacterized protein (TIGR02996 family)